MRNPSDGGDGWGDDPDTPDVDEGANDDYGDLRVLPTSPVIDAGDDSLLPADAFDMDGDGDTHEPIPVDLAGSRRVEGGTVDMGAYEFFDAAADDPYEPKFASFLRKPLFFRFIPLNPISQKVREQFASRCR